MHDPVLGVSPPQQRFGPHHRVGRDVDDRLEVRHEVDHIESAQVEPESVADRALALLESRGDRGDGHTRHSPFARPVEFFCRDRQRLGRLDRSVDDRDAERRSDRERAARRRDRTRQLGDQPMRHHLGDVRPADVGQEHGEFVFGAVPDGVAPANACLEPRRDRASDLVCEFDSPLARQVCQPSQLDEHHGGRVELALDDGAVNQVLEQPRPGQSRQAIAFDVAAPKVDLVDVRAPHDQYPTGGPGRSEAHLDLALRAITGDAPVEHVVAAVGDDPPEPDAQSRPGVEQFVDRLGAPMDDLVQDESAQRALALPCVVARDDRPVAADHSGRRPNRNHQVREASRLILHARPRLPSAEVSGTLPFNKWPHHHPPCYSGRFPHLT